MFHLIVQIENIQDRLVVFIYQHNASQPRLLMGSTKYSLETQAEVFIDRLDSISIFPIREDSIQSLL